MVIVTIILAITVVAEAAIFVWYLDRRDKRERAKDYEYQQRLHFPERVPAPPPIIEKAEEIAEEEAKPPDEFDAVGRIDPPLPLRKVE